MTAQGTEDVTVEAQDTDGAAEAAPPEAGTPSDTNEATLRSRISGLDAKVSELSGQKADLARDLEAARQRASDLEQGKVSGEEALRAQLATKQQEIDDAKREAAQARLASRFPEAARELDGVDLSLISEDKLAALEARLVGEAPEASATRGMRAPKAAPSEPPKVETSADLVARLKAFPNPFQTN